MNVKRMKMEMEERSVDKREGGIKIIKGMMSGFVVGMV